ncbi:MAG: hypothetical protein ACJ0GM_03495 [Parasynechococcus sp.]
MGNSTIWISLNDLGRCYGISTIHCGKILNQQGWRDRCGQPTAEAFKAEAARHLGPHGQTQSVVWNQELCGDLLETKGHQPVSLSRQIDQWSQLLEAMQSGSPSITSTADQMAEDMPSELVDGVNQQLAERGCSFRVHPVP